MLVNPFTLHNCSITQTSFHLKMFFGVLMCSTYSVFIVKDHLSLFYEAAVQCPPIVRHWENFLAFCCAVNGAASLCREFCAQCHHHSVTVANYKCCSTAWPQRRAVSPELALPGLVWTALFFLVIGLGACWHRSPGFFPPWFEYNL